MDSHNPNHHTVGQRLQDTKCAPIYINREEHSDQGYIADKHSHLEDQDQAILKALCLIKLDPSLSPSPGKGCFRALRTDQPQKELWSGKDGPMNPKSSSARTKWNSDTSILSVQKTGDDIMSHSTRPFVGREIRI